MNLLKGKDRQDQQNNLDFLNKKIEGNRAVMRDLEIKMDNVKSQTEDQKNIFLEREMLNKIKYDETEKKLSDFQRKVRYNIIINRFMNFKWEKIYVKTNQKEFPK